MIVIIISEVTIINQLSLSNVQFLSTVVHVVSQSSDLISDSFVRIVQSNVQ